VVGAGDIACLQLRLKDKAGKAAADDEILCAAETIQPVTQAAEVALLINDRPDLAKQSGADGVHLGQSDTGCREARALLGEEASIGVTCHGSIDLAFQAGEDGADYVAFGAFFPTETKQAPARTHPEILAQWAEATVLPSVAIGGITPQSCAPLVAAGADFLAVSGAVWNGPNGPEEAVRSFMNAIDEAS